MKKRFTHGDANERGTIRQVTYQTVNEKGETVEKYANVYLPYQYDPEKPYNIFYLIHGGGGNPDAWLDSCSLKNMLDLSIQRGELNPLIVVTPTYYTEGTGKPGMEGEGEKTMIFQKELVEDLMPAVESAYHTYAQSTDLAGLKASRFHRGIGGFSMGSVTTWNAFLRNIDYIAYFMPLSGDCWAIEQLGGSTQSEKTAQYLHDAVIKSGYKPDEYFIYTATGTEDIAFKQLYGQVNAMLHFPDTFVDATGFGAGNFCYHFEEGGVHAYTDVCQYVYQALPCFFKK
mgnify:CR=1 FL=1